MRCDAMRCDAVESSRAEPSRGLALLALLEPTRLRASVVPYARIELATIESQRAADRPRKEGRKEGRNKRTNERTNERTSEWTLSRLFETQKECKGKPKNGVYERMRCLYNNTVHLKNKGKQGRSEPRVSFIAYRSSSPIILHRLSFFITHHSSSPIIDRLSFITLGFS